jgi:hypothetical protein
VPDSSNRKTAKLLSTLGDEEPRKFRRLPSDLSTPRRIVREGAFLLEGLELGDLGRAGAAHYGKITDSSG